ncbi:MAG: molybdate ABC transporter substrate-binding protein, partial [Spirochaetota bacterium]
RIGSRLQYVVCRPGITGEKGLWTAALLSHNPAADAQEIADAVGVSRQYVNQVRRSIAGNSLVLIGRKGARVPTPAFTTDFRIKQAAPEHIAIGDPSHVPVGSYTMALFDSLGWTHHLSEKLIMAKDVTAVLRYVELGECDWGFVYSSEALQSDTAVILAHVPPQLHPDITFYIALSTEADVAARKLYSLITGETGQDVFARHGFPAVQVQ